MSGKPDRDALDRWELFALGRSLDMIVREQTVEFDYDYDAIGNRETSAVDGSTRVYTTNDLNQYHPITNPDETVFYDDDGNLSQEVWQDHVLQLLWDGENRLIQVTHVVPAESVRSVTYSYDYLGRMVGRQVDGLDVTQQPPTWETESVTLYVYDGWRMILELDALDEDAPQRSHYWGLDVSGYINAMAGIGGLLATIDHVATPDPITYFVLFDGHGNVTQLADAGDGSEAAEFEYDPYGNRIDTRLDQPLPFGFSTKFFEPETGLYYYGFRWYQAAWGRWVSRDPIGERGGLNAYGFVGNNPSGGLDLLGLYDGGPWLPPPTPGPPTPTPVPWIVTWLPTIPGKMVANGWTKGPALMDKWFTDATKDASKAIITMSWVLGYPRARTVYDGIFADQVYANAASAHVLRKRVQGLQVGDKVGDLSKPVEIIDRDDYINQRPHMNPGNPLDDLTAALARFNFRIAIEGVVCSKSTIRIDKVGVYVRDSYDFEGDQSLGYWQINGNGVSRSWWWGYYGVDNADFRKYREQTGKGYDFVVFSDVKVTAVTPPMILEY